MLGFSIFVLLVCQQTAYACLSEKCDDIDCPNGYKTSEQGCRVCECLEGVCAQPIVVGRCRAAIPRFAYDASKGLCVPFRYGGCGGNENNFETLEECVNQCVPCPKLRCKECENGNLKDIRGCFTCQCRDDCDLPAEPGTCSYSKPRYFHNPANRQCEAFTYTGCGGNANNFKNKYACNKQCKACKRPECLKFIKCGLGIGRDENGCLICGCLLQENICSQPVKVGPCRDYTVRYYFNSEDGSCRPFLYGGCAGNENNYLTQEACEDSCGPKCPEVLCRNNCVSGFKNDENGCQTCECNVPCDEPITVGPCRGAFPRFGYDQSLRLCVPFSWGGCGDNGNNFENFQDCVSSCANCPLVKCSEPCPEGFKINKRGCQTCQCKECSLADRDTCGFKCLSEGKVPVSGQECNGCQCIDVCALTLCLKGKVCVGKKVECVREPCFPVPECVEDCTLARKDECGFKCLKKFQVPVAGEECNGCPCQPVCALTDCPSGSTCQAEEIRCIRAPCFPEPACVEDCPLEERDACGFKCLAKDKVPCVGYECLGCPCQDVCSGKVCPKGQVCESQEVTCVRAPCFPQAVCVGGSSSSSSSSSSSFSDSSSSNDSLTCAPRDRGYQCRYRRDCKRGYACVPNGSYGKVCCRRRRGYN